MIDCVAPDLGNASELMLYEWGSRQMSIDYDVRRETDDAEAEASLEELKARAEPAQASPATDEGEVAETFEPPGADLSAEELAVRVVPEQQDEFTCSTCFLVHHRSQLARVTGGQQVCSDCTA